MKNALIKGEIPPLPGIPRDMSTKDLKAPENYTPIYNLIHICQRNNTKLCAEISKLKTYIVDENCMKKLLEIKIFLVINYSKSINYNFFVKL